MKKIVIKLLVDRSGSMASMRKSAMDAIQSFIDERRDETIPQKISLSEFNTSYDLVYPFVNIKDAPVYVLLPRGGTALNDAIVSAIKELDEYKPDKDRERFLVIMTDGEENSSKEHTKASIKALIDDRQAKGWHVIYLGANQDAVKVAAEYGIDEGSSLTYDMRMAPMAMGAVGQSIGLVSRGKSGSFSEAQRQSAVGKRLIKDNPQA